MTYGALRHLEVSLDPLEQKQPGSIQSIGVFFLALISLVVLKGSLSLEFRLVSGASLSRFCELVLSGRATRTVFTPLAELVDSTHFA